MHNGGGHHKRGRWASTSECSTTAPLRVDRPMSVVHCVCGVRCIYRHRPSERSRVRRAFVPEYRCLTDVLAFGRRIEVGVVHPTSAYEMSVDT